jgi:hypothetical protein
LSGPGCAQHHIAESQFGTPIGAAAVWSSACHLLSFRFSNAQPGDPFGNKAVTSAALLGASMLYFISAAHGFTTTSECIRFKEHVHQLDDDEGDEAAEVQRLRERVAVPQRGPEYQPKNWQSQRSLPVLALQAYLPSMITAGRSPCGHH